MSIAWELTITVLDYKERHVTVTGTRTDNADPSNPKIYAVSPVHIDTPAQQTAALNAIWAMHSADVALAAKVAAFAPTIAALEAAAKINLEARET